MSKQHAMQQTEMLQQKAREVEEMRQQRAVDERERQARLVQLSTTGKK